MNILKFYLSTEEEDIIEKHKNNFDSKADFVRCAIRQYEQNEREVEKNNKLDLILKNQLAIEKLIRQQLESPHPEDEIEELPEPYHDVEELEDLPDPHYYQRPLEAALEKPSDPHYYQRHPEDALEDLPWP